MSDYFGALMNLSGLAAPRAPRVPQVATPASDVAEVDVVREVAAEPHVDAPRSLAPPAAPAAREPRDAHPEAPSPEPPRQAAEIRAPALPPAYSAAEADDAPPGNTPEPVGRRLIRAATEWVRTDPHAMAATVPSEHRSESVAAAPVRGRDPVASTEQDAPAIARGEPVRSPTRAVSTAPASLATAVPTRAMEAASRVVLMEPPAALRAMPATRADETVEISIGAIHVRVDAPQPRPAAEAAPVRAAAAAPPARCALARRALRRI